MRKIFLGLMIILFVINSTYAVVQVDENTTVETLSGTFNYTFPYVMNFTNIDTYNRWVQFNYTNISIIPNSGNGNATVYNVIPSFINLTVYGTGTSHVISFSNLTANKALFIEDNIYVRPYTNDTNITFTSSPLGLIVNLYEYNNNDFIDLTQYAQQGTLYDQNGNILSSSIGISHNYSTTVDTAPFTIHYINTSMNLTGTNLNLTAFRFRDNQDSFLWIDGNNGINYLLSECYDYGDVDPTYKQMSCILRNTNVIDSTLKSERLIGYESEVTLSSPLDDFVSSSTNDTQPFIFSYTNTYSSTMPCSLIIDDVIVYTNSSTVNNTVMTFFSNTSLTNTSHEWKVRCGAEESETKTFWIDQISPVISTYSVTNYTNGRLHLNYTITENDTDSTCVFYIYNNGTIDSLTGIWNDTTGRVRICEKDIGYSDITYEGFFIVGVNITDSEGHSTIGTNQTNFTNTILYAGYNFITADRNITLENLANSNTGISRISVYSPTNQNYTTYVVGLSTNKDIQLTDGDVALVRVGSTTSFIRQYTLDGGMSRNISLVLGYNTAGIFNHTSVTTTDLCNQILDNTSASITHTSIFDPINQKFNTHRCGTSIYNSSVITVGKGYFLRLNTTSTMGIYR